MKIFLILITVFALSTANAQSFGRDWKFQKNTTFGDIYKRGASIHGVLGFSLPEGQQAIVTYVNTASKSGTLLYRCIEYFDEKMRLTREACYSQDKD